MAATAMTKPKGPTITIEETGRTKETTERQNIPGTSRRKVFSSGPIKGYMETNFNAVGPESWPIYSWLMLEDGRWFNFHRIANINGSGVVDLEQVDMRNEIIISPGLIYRIGIVSPPELAKWRAAQDRIERGMKVTASIDGLDIRA